MFEADLLFVLAVISGVALIYLLFRDVKINKREPIS
jgi:hypothetical protein